MEGNYLSKTPQAHARCSYSQAKASLLEKTTTGWKKYKQECLKMLQESTVDAGKKTSRTIKKCVK